MESGNPNSDPTASKSSASSFQSASASDEDDRSVEIKIEGVEDPNCSGVQMMRALKKELLYGPHKYVGGNYPGIDFTSPSC